MGSTITALVWLIPSLEGGRFPSSSPSLPPYHRLMIVKGEEVYYTWTFFSSETELSLGERGDNNHTLLVVKTNDHDQLNYTATHIMLADIWNLFYLLLEWSCSHIELYLLFNFLICFIKKVAYHCSYKTPAPTQTRFVTPITGRGARGGESAYF